MKPLIQDTPGLAALYDFFKKFPAVSGRNMLRFISAFATKNPSEIQALISILQDMKEKLKTCPECFAFTELELCAVCADPTKNHQKVCVVASWIDFLSIRSSLGSFSGVFHILGGLISPLEGIESKNLTIDSFVRRIEVSNVQDVIFAFSPTPEGEVTCSYILNLLKQKNLFERIKFFRIATGLPVGMNLEFADRSTINQAFSEMREI